ncbi:MULTISPECIES: hypothetical protein [Nocardia]|uniref:hypothetical protein n=1 Tax=Nocardia TaxID=1817 RepID=UPI0007A3EABD|nr:MULTISPECIES: hypothetical protein [Nocardia]
MPLYSFIEVRKWVSEVAQQHGVELSNRKCKDVAYLWITEQELVHDGVAGDLRLHSDPTGDKAVKRLLSILQPA